MRAAARRRTVSASAANLCPESIRSHHHGTALKGRRAGFHVSPDMETDQPVAAAHQRMVLHLPRTAVPDFLLRGLKNKEDVNEELRLQLREHARRH